MSKFKVGDRVRYKKESLLEGRERTVRGVDILSPDSVTFEGGGWESDRWLELVEPATYEDGWTLNDGKVEIPHDAKTLKEGDDVVAFKRRIAPKVVYVNVYKNKLGGLYVGGEQVSRKEADIIADTDRVACVKITEGQFDD